MPDRSADPGERQPARTTPRPFGRSLGAALRGIYVALKAERNLKIHVAAMCLVVAAGFYVGLSAVKWGLTVFAIGLVIAAEIFNTAIERLGDEVSGGGHSPAVKDAKDISAGAVLLCAATAFVIGVPVLVIPLVKKLAGLL